VSNLHDPNRVVANTAVLAFASKFSRKDIFSILFAHSKTLLDRAILACTCDVTVAQSIMMHVFWKEPTDTTSWMKIGVAIRMAYQMRWHEGRKQDLPAGDTREARLQLVSVFLQSVWAYTANRLV
jgi:hypothetical protein